ncbi:MAG: hypothetical protein E7057_07880 [Lentisphaerae bacterium]|nr:hypothetical protein [Lentisphaerota bacterium]
MTDPNLEALLILQDADMRRKGMEQRLLLLPKEMDAILARKGKLEAETAAAAELLKKEELSIKQCENEIARLTADSQKLQQQSALVKKNNEYQAMLGQIADNKRKIGEIEETLLEKFDNVAQLRENAEKIRRENALKLRNARTEFEELLAFSKTVKAEIAKSITDRPALAANVRDELLTVYNRLLKGKDNSAPLTKLDNGCCGNCHMRVTMQTLNELSKGKIEHCDSCQHLLYADVEQI